MCKYSLYWTLQESLIFGSRLDVEQKNFSYFDRLIKSHVTTLGRLIHITGPELSNTKAMAEKLSLKLMSNNSAVD